ncbi:hypothetical protein O6H91_03G006300 [Diphasiastrum complanatum]|uniref:Uncharacterized protein n=1 Tax=Diphasiastrum complanatum TaxID=34168 RepID=A0ACC2E361_DIPCM|nr:hypothetical protein O6H91_03G006300 [Diphasiastrum complanatum]
MEKSVFGMGGRERGEMKQGKGKGKGKAGDHGGERAIIGDPRFARLHSDPRFQRVVKSKIKVPIDSRFQRMFWDKNFLDPLGVDKRGKRAKKKDKHLLNRYYRVEEEQPDALAQHSEEEEVSKIVEGKQKKKSEVVKAKKDEATGNGRKESSGARKSKLRVRVSDSDAESSGYEKFEELDPDNGQSNAVESAFSAGFIEAEDEDSEESEEEYEEMLPHSLREKTTSAADSGREKKSLGGKYSDLESISSSEESDASDSDSSSTSDEDIESAGEEESDHDEEKVATIEEETRRLAMVNLDWDHIKAADLLILMNSFLPKGGHIESVAIYPSQFGLQQMKNEEQHGPKGVFEPNNEGQDSDEEDEIDMEKLRKYEKAKLRYYFAVVTCDSSATASSLYTACDGMEFERTSNVLDMRFVPDNMKFEVAPRDTAVEVPADYKAPEFETRALQHSNVKLTWDDEEPVRVKALRQKFSSDQLNEMDFKAYLASEDDSESDDGYGPEVADEEDETRSAAAETNKSEYSKRKLQRERYRSLLLGSDETGISKKSQKVDLDMEITFHSGLSELSKRLSQQQESKRHEGETVWEAYLRKKKEKKKARKKEQMLDSGDEKIVGKQSEEESQGEDNDAFFQHDEHAFDDPFFNSDEEKMQSMEGTESIASKRRAKKAVTSNGKSYNEEGGFDWERKRQEHQKKREEEGRSKAELELLLMDDHNLQSGIKGFNLKAKKPKGKKKLKGGKHIDGEDKQAELHATADYNDPRFSSLFSSHHFAIDPTDPQYTRFILFLIMLDSGDISYKLRILFKD